MKDSIYKLDKKIFTTNELAVLWDIDNRGVLKNKIYYWVRNNKLKRLKRGVYSTSDDYDGRELAGKLLSPSYVSLSTVLVKAGVIFQYDSGIYSVAELSREYRVEAVNFYYKKIKNRVFFCDLGLIKKENYTIASLERALLDTMYLVKDADFDNLLKIDWRMCYKLVDIYENKRLEKDLKKLHKNFKEE